MSSCKILYIDVGMRGGLRGGGITEPVGMSFVGLERVKGTDSNWTGCHQQLRVVISPFF